MTILRLPIFARTFLNRCVGEYAIVGAWHPKIFPIKSVERRHYATAIELKVDSQNVISSGVPDVTGFESVHLHNLIWEKVDRWSNRTALTTLINPAYTKYEIKRQVENADVQAIFTIPAKYADVDASIENNSKIKLPVVIVNDGTDPTSIAGTIKFADLVRDDIEEFSVSQKTDVNYDDTVLMFYSSGTTGLPKSIESTHRNIAANIFQATCPQLFAGVETTEHYQDIVPMILPLYHVYGLVIVMYSFLRIGAKLVCMPQFSLTKLIKLLEDYRCTVMHAVPPIVQMIAYDERIMSRHFEFMRLIVSGAAPLGEESIAKFQNRVSNCVTFVQGYGASELSPLASTSLDAPSASCGYLVPNTQMRIVGIQQDNLGKNLSPRQVGEIYIRGPQVMKGYYKNPQATADTMDGDWYKTGDLGYYCEHGLYVQARLKEMIKVKGFQVAPTELEEVIRGNSKIQDVAVIGVAHDQYGEIPKAFVVPKSGVKIDENEIKVYVAERVAKFKHLGYVQVVESIPKSGAGKILRKELKKL
ncbi:4-coumarate--CoA ligase 1-like isoform X2 [Nylanderia fulva]|uniref:4-coumarate--CoA ligase 1-like isoform X2 n=1 Tax=Nylanderia fulva TaxID=613905 RepID=UPI0010FB32A8|nr:4-coumarate--CoA ligase 1-like isoform X2 [Nylanderia fulva]